jgi:putative oxidoreductase
MDQNKTRDMGLLMIRLILAVVFIYHGQGKLFGGLDGFAGYLASMNVPMPKVAAFLAAISEFGGGLILLTGLAFRFTLPPVVFTMLVAAFKAHGGKFNIQDGGMEYPLTLGIITAALILTGPGSLTLARFRSTDSNQPAVTGQEG